MELIITPTKATIDTPREIRVSGLQPFETIEISTETLRAGIPWRSHARFKADVTGMIDLTQQAPLPDRDQDYQTIDPMGLIWSQTPDQIAQDHARDTPIFSQDLFEPIATQVRVTGVQGTIEATLWQQLADQGIRRIEVREKGLVGVIYQPKTEGPHPAIMILNGSGGGMNEPRAALYASRGYIAFALAYFKAPGLSDYISNTNLEYFKTGLDWLRQRYNPLHNFVALNGQSRGGELVLLLASFFPDDVSAVIAYVPGAVIHSGQNAADPKIGREAPTWYYQGKALPHLWENNRTASWAPFDEGPNPHRHEWAILTALDDPEAVERAMIPVEKIRSPILLISGTDDGAWPSSRYCQMIIERLAQYDFPYAVHWCDTPNAGHSILFPYLPTTQITHTHPVSGRINSNGGCPQANAKANEASWQAVQTFLTDLLKESL